MDNEHSEGHTLCDAQTVSNVSLAHEAPLEVLRQCPTALLDLLRVVGGAVDYPGDLTVEVLDSELTEASPSVRQADFVTLLRDQAGRPFRSVIVEVQRDRDDEELFAWPLYMAYLRSQYRVPVTLLVVTFDTHVATWARDYSIVGSVGSDLSFASEVIGPDDLPEIASLEEACAHPELSVLTALVRNGDRDLLRLAEHDAEVLRIWEAMLLLGDRRLRMIYLSLLDGTTRVELRAKLRKLTEEHGMGALEMIRALGEAEGKAEGEAKGKAEGEAAALLRVLRARGLHVDEAAETRIRETRDISLLDRWLERAATATALDHVLAE